MTAAEPDPCPDPCERLVDCPACQATGTIDHQPCPVCDGTRVAWPEEVISWLEDQDDDWQQEWRHGIR